jgi:segregation and condensation protein B
MQNKEEQLNILSKKIEAILFYLNDEVYLKELASHLNCDVEEVKEALHLLDNNLKDRGISLVIDKDKISLGTSKEFSDLIEKIAKEELNKDLSQASLDTLSIILYKSPITKKEIEYIRGVNSSFSIRNLFVRGLIERDASKLDERIYLYKPTLELFRYLGISKIEDMPEWNNLQDELKALLDLEQVKSDNNTDN